jgi:hypothetical protein
MMDKIYNVFRIPYYYALITRHGEVIRRATIPMHKTKKHFSLKGVDASFVIPNDKQLQIPPIKIKSGRLLLYDVNSAQSMKLIRKSTELIEFIDDDTVSKVSTSETNINNAVLPQQFAIAPTDINQLHDFLEAKIVEDIMSDDKKEFPMWVIYLIAVAAVVVLILGALYMVTHGNTATIQTIVTPTPTPGYIVHP